METLIMSWYVLVQTDSALMVGIVGALRFLGTLLSPLLGVYVDRLSKRSVMIGMRVVFAIVAMSVVAIAQLGTLEVWHLMVAAGASGLLRAPEMVVRQSLIADSVPRPLLINAIGLNRITMDSSRVVGAVAGAGAMVALGVGNAYLIIALMYLGSIVFSLRLRIPYVALADRASALKELWSGVAHIRSSPVLSGVMGLAFFANLLAFPLTQGLLPMFARDIFALDEVGLAQFIASAAVGALVGSICVGLLPNRHPDRVMLVGILLWNVCLLAFAVAPSLVLAHACLFLSGTASSFGMISLAGVLLGRADPDFRGRVMGVRMLAVYGLPIGLLLGGALIEQIGVRETVACFAVAGLLVFSVAAWRWSARVARDSGTDLRISG
jgi:MFS family permease